MASKIVFVVAQVLLIQLAFGQQYIGRGATVTGNSVVDNDIIINGGYGGLAGLGNLGISTSGLAASGYGGTLALGGSGVSLGSGLGLAGAGFGLGGLAGGYGSVNVAAPVGISSATLAGLGGGYNIIASSPLAVTTVSPIGPSGLAIASENAIDGLLAVSGQLPFLSAVAFDGAFPTSGSGVATCGCGNGQVGIISEGFGPAPIGFPGPIGLPTPLPIGVGYPGGIFY